MIKSDVSAQYKTKECKKYAQNGYCPYGQRCLYIHGPKDVLTHQKKESSTKFSYADERVSITPTGHDIVRDSLFDLVQVSKTPKSQQSKKKQIVGVSNAMKLNPPREASYSEIVVHCINVSLQEQQKKLAMYHKKVERRCVKSMIEDVERLQPDFQYINIYQGKSRLNCFSKIKLEESYNYDPEDILFNHCDAATYEGYLDSFCKNFQSQQRAEMAYKAEMSQTLFQSLSAVNSNPCARPRAGSDVIINPSGMDVHSIVYNKMIEMSILRQQKA